MRMRAFFLSAALVLAVLALTPGRAPSQDKKSDVAVGVFVVDKEGNILVEGAGSFSPKTWTVQSCIDPKGDYLTLRGLSWQIVLWLPGNDFRNPFPVEPRGDFFSVEFPEGGILILRLPSGYGETIARAEASYRGSVYALSPITALDVARIQLSGKPIQFNSANPPLLDVWFSRADNRSVVAYHDGVGQMEALMQAAWVLTKMLQSFRNINGEYPMGLCQLYRGERAILSAVPLNPFEIKRTLCDSRLSVPRPRGAVKYYPEVVVDADGNTSTVVGYWLAILGVGEVAPPRKTLPGEFAAPLRAISWFEVHPEDPDDMWQSFTFE